MAPKPDPQSVNTVTGGDSSSQISIDPFFHILKVLPFSFLRPPRLRLKIPSFSLPSAMTVFSLILLTYFMVVSGFVYDVIVEPPGIGSTQDPATGAVRPVVFMSGRVNGQYIIEGLSSGFMFVLGGIGIVLLDLALDKNRTRSIKVSYAISGVSSIVIAYVMTTLFIRIKIPGYLSGKTPPLFLYRKNHRAGSLVWLAGCYLLAFILWVLLGGLHVPSSLPPHGPIEEKHFC